MRAPVLTPAEAEVLHHALVDVWIPKEGHKEFLSALHKLEAMSRQLHTEEGCRTPTRGKSRGE